MDSGSLHIARWGSETDLIGEKLKIRKGDVLFARRNAYLKRVAIAPFDGLFSAHGMVLRPKIEVIVPEFFPFFLYSEYFLNRAIKISVGSLSPTVNWKTLKQEVFKLPPLDEQKRIAELLWAIDESRQKFIDVHANADILFRTFIDDWISSHMDKLVPFAELWSRSPQSGCSAPEIAKETNHYVLSLSALTRDGYQFGQLKQVVPTDKMLNATLTKGDFLISRSNTAELVGLVGIYNENRGDVSFPDTMMRLKVSSDVIRTDYLETVLLSSYGRKLMKRICAGTSHSMKKINRKTLGEINIPLVSTTKQNELMQSVHLFTEMLNNCTEHENHYTFLLAAQIEKLVGGASDV